MAYPVPANETDRLKALDAYDIVGTPPSMDFDEIAETAGQICGCPVAVINLIAERWEWYKGKYGIPEDVNCEPRGGVCSTTICCNDFLIVRDLTKDERFAHQSMVKGDPYFRFYAGDPLINSDGYALGSLCVLDYQPREIGAQQIAALRCLTHQAVAQPELRRKVAELEEMTCALAEEKNKAEDLLRNILPESVVKELTTGGCVQPRYHDFVTILFTDFKNFTRLTEKLEPRALIGELNDHFSAFDDIVTRYGLEKLKTIGDAYMRRVACRGNTGRTRSMRVRLPSISETTWREPTRRATSWDCPGGIYGSVCTQVASSLASSVRGSLLTISGRRCECRCVDGGARGTGPNPQCRTARLVVSTAGWTGSRGARSTPRRKGASAVTS